MALYIGDKCPDLTLHDDKPTGYGEWHWLGGRRVVSEEVVCSKCGRLKDLPAEMNAHAHAKR